MLQSQPRLTGACCLKKPQFRLIENARDAFRSCSCLKVEVWLEAAVRHDAENDECNERRFAHSHANRNGDMNVQSCSNSTFIFVKPQANLSDEIPAPAFQQANNDFSEENGLTSTFSDPGF